MRKFITTLFVTLGVIFSIIILFVVYLFIFDPFNIKPLFFGSSSNYAPQNINTDNGTSTASKKPFLSEEQKKTLAKFGIDPATIPSSINVTQEECFKSKLGSIRFAEIVAGDSPSITEFISAKSCI
jgi:hypothetical protein